MVTNAAIKSTMKVFTEFKNIFFADGKEVFYIGGAEVLPAPLEQEEEQQAIEELTTGKSEQAKKKLIEHNLRLVVYIAKNLIIQVWE